MRVLLLDDFVSPAVEKIESLDNLIGRLITTVRKIGLDDRAFPLEMAVGLEIIGRVQDGQNQLHQFVSMSSFPATFLMSCAI